MKIARAITEESFTNNVNLNLIHKIIASILPRVGQCRFDPHIDATYILVLDGENANKEYDRIFMHLWENAIPKIFEVRGSKACLCGGKGMEFKSNGLIWM